MIKQANSDDQAIESGSAVHIATVVLGTEHISRMLRHGLPSIVSCLERSALVRKHSCTFFIYTRERDVESIKGAAIISSLQKSISVEIVPVEVVPSQYNWSVAKIHNRISNRAHDENAYVMFLLSDAVYSTELFGAVDKAVTDERSVLFVPSLRVNMHSVSQALDKIKTAQAGCLTLDSREVVKLAFEHLHISEKRLYWGQGERSLWLNHLYFAAGENAVVALCWHLHPLLIRPRSRVSGALTLDSGKYLESVKLDIAQLEVITDSDHGFFVELSTGGERQQSFIAKRISIRTCVTWALRHTQPLHRLIFIQPILIHAGEVIPASIEPTRRFSEEILQEIVHDYDYGRAHRLRLWAKMLLSPSGMTQMVLYPVKKVIGRLVRVCYRILWPTIKGAASKVGGSLGFRNLIKRIMSGSGLARWALGLFLKMASREVAYNQSTIAEDAIVGQFTFDRGMRALNDGKLEEALGLVRTSNLLAQTDEKIFYEELIATLIELRLQAQNRARQVRRSQTGSNGEPLVFAVVVWGQSYVKAFLNYTVRTMLAPGNLPALGDRQLIFSIVTDEGSLHLFEASFVFRELKKHAEVVFFTFPSGLAEIGHYSSPNFNFYRLYGALDHTSIHFARALGGHVFFVVADALYADGTLLSLFKYLERGYEVCVNASLVANKEVILPLLDDRVGQAKSLNLSSRELANLCFRYRHDYISQRLMISANTNFDKYPRELYFPDRAGLVVYALYQHPWAISAAAISRNIEFDYHIVDFGLVSRIFAHSSSYEKLKVIEDSDEAFIANFAPQDRKFDTTGEPFNIRQFVAAHLRSQPIHWHIWRHRQLIRCDTGLHPEVNPEIIANDVLVALREAIQK